MTQRIEILFHKQPVYGMQFAFDVHVDGVALLEIAKTFGSPAAEDMILISGTMYTTRSLTRTNLETYNEADGVTYSEGAASVYIDIEAEGFIMVSGLKGETDYFSVYLHDPQVDGVAPFEVKYFDIQIIDTHDNERVLLEEQTQPDAPVLSYDGGEDLYQPLMTSNLTFNFAVPGYEDAKFLHLLTGDESRFLVRLTNEAEDGTVTLLWRGYLLPDMYEEVWKNGVPFIKFLATDRIALLKGKYFKPWFYEQVFTLPELFALILAETGLVQELHVRPLMVSVSYGEDYRWRDTKVYMKPFMDGDKFDDLYAILEKVLKAQGLQLFSWRGKWFLEGLTRRQNTTVIPFVENYHPDGIFKQNTIRFPELVAPYFSPSPLLKAETPWKKVALNFGTDSDKNLMPDDVLRRKVTSTEGGLLSYDGSSFNIEQFLDGYLAKWLKVGSVFLDSTGARHYVLWWKANGWYWEGSENYNISEAEALANYFECTVKPYAAPGRTYELEIEVEALISDDAGDFGENLKDGDYNGAVNFQLFFEADEIMSSRPSFADASLYEFDRDYVGPKGPYHKAMFKLKREFIVPAEGELTLRFLPMIGDWSELGYSVVRISPSVLKINLVEEPEDVESAIALRDVDTTQEYEDDLDITCTPDSAIENSFGIGTKLADRFFTIPVNSPVDFTDQQYFFPVTYLDVHLTRWPINALFQDIIFKYGSTGYVFLKKADGTEEPYNSLYTTNILNIPQMAVYKGFEPVAGNPSAKPKLPKGYKPLAAPGVGDTVKMMASVFNVEDRSKRALWKVYGFDAETAGGYMETLAYAYHCVRPEVCFSIDATALGLVWPLQDVHFPYDGEGKRLLPVRFSIQLFEGKTQLTMKEMKLTQLDDVTYE